LQGCLEASRAPHQAALNSIVQPRQPPCWQRA